MAKAGSRVSLFANQFTVAMVTIWILRGDVLMLFVA
jgi:hypothetical protein